MKKILKRNEVNVNETWDLTRLYKNENKYNDDLEKLEKLVNNFSDKYLNNLKTSKDVLNALKDYEEINKLFTYTGTYQSLHTSVDQTNDDNLKRSGNYNILSNQLSNKLTFFNTTLLKLDNKILKDVIKLDKSYETLINDTILNKKYKLSEDVEKALSKFSPVLSAPYSNYNSFKFGDMSFSDFNVSNKSYVNSFTMFENEWSYELNHNVRRKAFESFYNDLKKYQTGLANNYQTQVLKEKAYADLKGFNSTIDYLLHNQKVSVDMYDRQIDLIMEHLKKPMQKYVKLIKDIYNLDKLTYADLHLSIDPEYEREVSIKEAKKHSIESLKVFGEEYKEMVLKSFDERWIDFPQNLGKSTGGFCSSPYQKGSFILLNWNSQLNETFVLAHELGHAGHFYFASQNQNIFNTRSSMYFIEAPSTMNELIMSDYFLKQNKDDLRFKRYILSNIISRTYYHNFVTHLLEAHFQREVYKLVDSNQPINVNVLNKLKLNTLKLFWEDTVEIDDYASLTWMRQPHYFMGLYPYTYSAGLTISTSAFNKIKNNELNYSDWLEVLKAGGSKNPLDLAKMVDVDLSTEKPLLETISFIESIIDEIIELTNQINKK